MVSSLIGGLLVKVGDAWRSVSTRQKVEAIHNLFTGYP